MQIVVAGSQGLIGSALVEHLAGQGHQVRRLVRREPRCSREIRWDPGAGELDPAALAGVDAVVNLGGAGLGDHRWNAAYRSTILTSRTGPTALLARRIADLGDEAPTVLLQGSAVGVYGDRGDEVVTESSAPGEGFLVDVVRSWEAATAPAEAAGTRVAHLRTGIVMSRTGGSFGRLLPLLRLGVGGPLGPGQNFWGWITLPDQVRAIEHLLTAEVSGPVNLTAPAPARQRDVIRAVARALHRPAVVSVPRVALRIAIGEFADDILSSQRAVPTVLAATGFRHTHPDLTSAAEWVTRRPDAPR
ncbi:TIGR01777 family oxidoreductase [Actinotalea sp. K2]|uniref:TIGR01777 family oxidoreductase n=1 Tax=Actinotalea sp. K2 TaxID=2939438 RepID=UPI002017743A|nr:TIGR01777 family oxidoreductase [Actinotalea sp. K2]MCL3860714.1 TIGR01777 family oxidoreductase [Actinotalea sp. K2]